MFKVSKIKGTQIRLVKNPERISKTGNKQASTSPKESSFWNALQNANKPKKMLMAENVLDVLPSSIIVTEGPQHRIIKVNQLAHNSHQNDLIGQLWLDVIAKSKRFINLPVNIRRLVEKAYFDGTPLILDELKEITSDGNIFYFRMQIFPLLNTRNQAEGLLIYAVETTALVNLRQQAEKVIWEKQILLMQVEDQRRHFNALVESVGAGLFLIGEDERVVYANQKIGELLRLDPQNTIGQTFRFILKQISQFTDNPDFVADQLEFATARHNGPIVVELSYAAKFIKIGGKSSHDLQLSFFDVFDENGRIIGRGCLIRDITSEKELERLKSNFISTVSHEMRTPLTGIYGYAELLLLRPATEDLQTLWISRIYDEARKLNEIVDELLDLSRIEAGRLELNKSKLNVQNLVYKEVEKFQSVEKQSVELHQFELEIEPDLPTVYADTLKVGKVLHNLISNAIKYSPLGGTIKIGVVMRKLEMVDQTVSFTGNDKSEILFSVRDEGIGIEPEEIERVFERFYRTRRSLERKIRGTGLGLSIAKSLVEMHKGQIWAESHQDKYTTFYFTLPIN